MLAGKSMLSVKPFRLINVRPEDLFVENDRQRC